MQMAGLGVVSGVVVQVGIACDDGGLQVLTGLGVVLCCVVVLGWYKWE